MKGIHRRRFLWASSALAAAPLILYAQPTQNMRRLGILNADSNNRTGLDRSFFVRLRELGWTEGNNLAVEIRYAQGDNERLPQLAQELLQQKVDVIFTLANPSSLEAARKATTTIPIVMAGGYPDNVRAGIIQSLARPGGNITGATLTSEDLLGKRLQLLKELVPDLARVGTIAEATPAGTILREGEEASARLLRIELTHFFVREPSDFESTLLAARKSRIQAFVVTGQHQLAGPNAPRMAELLIKHRFPSMAVWGFQADRGYLAAYGASVADVYRTAAVYVDKIFRGAKPADLPVEQPNLYHLVINLKTAKSLGITIPQTVLLRAERVIE